jgi:hypothetical protein
MLFELLSRTIEVLSMSTALTEVLAWFSVLLPCWLPELLKVTLGWFVCLDNDFARLVTAATGVLVVHTTYALVVALSRGHRFLPLLSLAPLSLPRPSRRTDDSLAVLGGPFGRENMLFTQNEPT